MDLQTAVLILDANRIAWLAVENWLVIADDSRNVSTGRLAREWVPCPAKMSDLYTFMGY